MKHLKRFNENIEYGEDVFTCRDNIEDLLLPLTDKGFDIEVIPATKYYHDIKSIEREIEESETPGTFTYKMNSDGKYVNKLKQSKTAYISIRFGIKNENYQFDYNDPVVNEPFGRMNDYCESIGMTKVDVRELEKWGEEWEGSGHRVGQIYYISDDLSYNHHTVTLKEFRNMTLQEAYEKCYSRFFS